MLTRAACPPGFINLARSGSLKIRNSLRRHGSVHRAQDHGAHNQQSSTVSTENLISGVSLNLCQRMHLAPPTASVSPSQDSVAFPPLFYGLASKQSHSHEATSVVMCS